MTDDEKKEAARRALDAREHPRRDDLYEHYKGGSYFVVSLSIDEATLEPLVTYTSHEHPSEIDTTRTLANFEEMVEIHQNAGGSYEVPRFRLVEV